MILWISGPTGSGKTSFAKMLADAGYAVIKETIDKHLFRAFSNNPARHCFDLQQSIMLSRFEQWKSLPRSGEIAFDRSIAEDLQVFCRMHHESGLLSEMEMQQLKALGRSLQEAMPLPDLIVYLCPERHALEERISAQRHPSTIKLNIGVQLDLYDQWLAAQEEDVLKVDNSNCTVGAVEALLGSIARC